MKNLLYIIGLVVIVAIALSVMQNNEEAPEVDAPATEEVMEGEEAEAPAMEEAEEEAPAAEEEAPEAEVEA
jgi:hypothetical protein